MLDYKQRSQYILRIKAFQQDNPVNRVTYGTIVIDVRDVNSGGPVMSQPLYEESLVENSPRGTKVLQVSATDPDLVSLLISYLSLMTQDP